MEAEVGLHPARRVIGDALWVGGALCTAAGAAVAGACLVVALTPSTGEEPWTEAMGIAGMVLGALVAGGGLVAVAAGQWIGGMDAARQRTTSAAVGALSGTLWVAAVLLCVLLDAADPRATTALWSLPGAALAVVNGRRLRRRPADGP